MLNFSPEKLFLVGVIALIVLGPNRLPQAARTLGRLVAQLRSMSASFQDEVRDALAEPTEAVTSAVAEFRLPDVRRSMREAVTSTFAPPVAAASPPDPNTAGDDHHAPPAAAGEAIMGAPAPAAPDDPSLN